MFVYLVLLVENSSLLKTHLIQLFLNGRKLISFCGFFRPFGPRYVNNNVTTKSSCYISWAKWSDKCTKRNDIFPIKYSCIGCVFSQGYHFVSTVKLTSHRLLYRNCTNITNMWHFLKVHDSKRSK